MEYVVAVLAVIALGVWFFAYQARAMNRGMHAGLKAHLEREGTSPPPNTRPETASSTSGAEQSLHWSDAEWNYSTFDEWSDDFKRACAKHNPSLEVNEDGASLVDFMEDEPLRRAYRDRVSPHVLGKQFAQQFNVGTFGG